MVNYDLEVPALRAHMGQAMKLYTNLTWETSVREVKAALFVQIGEEGRRRFPLAYPDIDLFTDIKFRFCLHALQRTPSQYVFIKFPHSFSKDFIMKHVSHVNYFNLCFQSKTSIRFLVYIRETKT